MVLLYVRCLLHSLVIFPEVALFISGVFRFLLDSAWLAPRGGPGGSGLCPFPTQNPLFPLPFAGWEETGVDPRSEILSAEVQRL